MANEYIKGSGKGRGGWRGGIKPRGTKYPVRFSARCTEQEKILLKNYLEHLRENEVVRREFKIINIFNAKDRLDELDEIPRLEDGQIDYWLASKLLCEKDGGRLPTMKELAEIASYMYQTEIDEFESKFDLKQINELIPVGQYWSSSEFGSMFAYGRHFYGDDSCWNSYPARSDSSLKSLCVGD